MYVEVVLSLSFCLGQPLHLPDRLTRYVHPWIGCNWLFFLIMSSYTYHCEICQSGTSPSESGSSIHSVILSLCSVFCFEFEAISAEVC